MPMDFLDADFCDASVLPCLPMGVLRIPTPLPGNLSRKLKRALPTYAIETAGLGQRLRLDG